MCSENKAYIPKTSNEEFGMFYDITDVEDVEKTNYNVLMGDFHANIRRNDGD